MTANKAKKIPLYSGLVTANPPKETAGKAIFSCLQNLSGRKPTVSVPQGEHVIAKRERHILLWDQALTPPDLPGSYGIEPWALDTARLVRARQQAERHGTLPAVPDRVWNDPVIKRRVAEATKQDPEGRTVQGKANLTRIGAACGLPGTMADHSAKLRTWDDVIGYAERLMRERESQHEGQKRQPSPSQDKYKPRGEKQKAKTAAIDGGGDPGESAASPADYKPSESPGTKESKGSSAPGKSPTSKAPPREKKVDHGTPSLDEQIKQNAHETADRYRYGYRYEYGLDDSEKDQALNTDPWHIGNLPQVRDGIGQYGHMTLGPDGRKPIELPMRPKRRVGGVRRAMFEGAFVKKPWRLHLDGKTFSGPVTRGRGGKGRGTVLVDLSGSMSWTEETLSAVLDALPECTILGYCGSDHVGALCTLADRGRTATMESIAEFKRHWRCGNTVDGPALQYLAQSSGPRVWFSDGGVTGRGDASHANLHQVAEAICLSGRIFRTTDVEKCCDYLSGNI